MSPLLRAFAALLSLAALGCAPMQSPECAAFLACQAAVDEALGTKVAAEAEAELGVDGSCWASESEAADCTRACYDDLALLSASYPELDACQAS
jgi:hypothetical protein